MDAVDYILGGGALALVALVTGAALAGNVDVPVGQSQPGATRRGVDARRNYFLHIYYNGTHAREAKYSRSTNPWPSGSTEAQAWDRGWQLDPDTPIFSGPDAPRARATDAFLTWLDRQNYS